VTYLVRELSRSYCDWAFRAIDERITTKKGAPRNLSDAIKAWEDSWRNLPQGKIQAWIERIPEHIEKEIDLEGGIEYKENREKH
jgi:hypothetical protein